MKAIAITTNAARNELLRKKLFWAMLAFIFLTSIGYALLVNATVRNIVSREKDQKELTQLQSSIAKLESEQIALKSGIDQAKAKEMGFHEVQDPQYVSFKSPSDTVSINR